jgi:hypothetical protein
MGRCDVVIVHSSLLCNRLYVVISSQGLELREPKLKVSGSYYDAGHQDI